MTGTTKDRHVTECDNDKYLFIRKHFIVSRNLSEMKFTSLNKTSHHSAIEFSPHGTRQFRAQKAIIYVCIYSIIFFFLFTLSLLILWNNANDNWYTFQDVFFCFYCFVVFRCIYSKTVTMWKVCFYRWFSALLSLTFFLSSCKKGKKTY